jgi:hypothetical protein
MIIAPIRMYFNLTRPVSMYLINGMNKEWNGKKKGKGT